MKRLKASPKRQLGRYQARGSSTPSSSRSTPSSPGPKARMPTGRSGAGSAPRSTRCTPARVKKAAWATSAQSWSSVATQNTAIAGSPAASIARAHRTAAAILESA